MKTNYCYHSHTSRCGHAIGTDEEYVLSAIKCGFKEFGFADHVMWPNHKQPGIRGDYELINNYFSSILLLKEKYKEQVNLHVGFECEYVPLYKDYYKSLLEDTPVEYLILGQHCFINEENKIEWYFSPNTPNECVTHYAKDLIEGMKTGLFLYVAHPDTYVTCFKKWNPFLEEIAHMICKAAEETNTPLEINVGKRVTVKDDGNLVYPCEEFWKVASNYKIKVYVSGDFHNAQVMSIDKYNFAYQIIEKYGFEELTKIK